MHMHVNAFPEVHEMGSDNKALNEWIKDVEGWLTPERIIWINGSDAENTDICKQLVQAGTFVPLNPKEYPNSFWSLSHQG